MRQISVGKFKLVEKESGIMAVKVFYKCYGKMIAAPNLGTSDFHYRPCFNKNFDFELKLDLYSC